MGLQHLLPATTRLYLRVWKRRCKDVASGRYRQFAVTKTNDRSLSASITVQQPIGNGDWVVNKIKNLALAVAQLQGIVIEPGKHFSFWHLVGRPSIERGYVKSRSIVQGQLITETGGGLCQLSGIIYLLALKAGLSIIERHAHSKDIYREAERFTPLGSDATVAYGYKDLRFTNTLPYPIRLQFVVGDQQLTGSMLCTEPIAEKQVHFTYTKHGSVTEAVTLVDGVEVGRSRYVKLVD